MKYMGSKRRIAKHIIPIMVKEADKKGIITWVEPFVGGANLIDKVPTRFKRIGYDYNEHVIHALNDIRDIPNDLPVTCDQEYFNSLKGFPPSTITSWLRFVCSYGGIFEDTYARGGGRNYCAEGKRNAIKQSPLIQGVDFFHSDYRNIDIENSLIYCDPPYQNSAGYNKEEFDHEEFFEWCRDQAKNNIVFISEYEAPFTEVWRGEIKTNFASSRKKATHDAIEKLFLV